MMMTALPVTALYCGLHTVVYGILSLRVGLGRAAAMKNKTQAETDELWQRKNRAQLSFGQYFAPIFLVLALIEANGVLSMSSLYALGGWITAARLAHVLNLSFPDLPIQLRMFGFLSTVAFFVLGGFLVTLIGLQETPFVSSNLLGTNRTWMGFANEKANIAADTAKSGYAKVKAKASEL